MTARLDVALAAQGLARSRTHARQLIADGLVTVDGRGIVKPSTPVAVDAVLAVASADHYVSRAAHKLVAALDAFGIPVTGRLALDLGASTGGFTQVLRERGAEPVIALDVGHGQLAPQIAADTGVIVVEGSNVRDLTPASLAAQSGIPRRPSIVTADLSFISVTFAFAPVVDVAADDADVVVLIKPQFEVGRTGVREGVVTDPGLRADAVASALWSAWDAGLGVHGFLASPIVGTHGNAEFLAHLRRRIGDSGNPSEWGDTVNRLAGER
ncbi:TlyA family RNA methyltransferase [Microbacterium sp. No. 7]|uniref:TlyA family RNA methyltransferase n=1 Tax=Microbacterium sp. No. 7 TaxID=1714373 RepID=UPI0006CF956C|nr:TlyA family RNA methyltransferase [Microbacterium sp. No. 7]ALJ20976.1 hemolysin [Microbacterium sp. No. 7]